MNNIKIVLIGLLVLFGSNIAFAASSGIIAEVSPSEVQFQMIDPLGNITGYDPITRTILNNIPYTHYFLFIPDHGELTVPVNKYEKANEIEPTLFSDTVIHPAGIYKVKLFGSIQSETFTLFIMTAYPHMRGNQVKLKSLIYPNVTWTYEVEIPNVPSPTGTLTLVKIASATDFIIDITAAGQLGYIGNAKFVSELIKEVQEIEKERTEVQKQNDKDKEHLTPAQKAIKEYKELLKEITEKYQRPEGDEFVKQEAYTVLKEDLDYIINHIQ